MTSSARARAVELLVRTPGRCTARATGGRPRLEALRRLLRPVQKLFWNPNPMIAALSRQSDLKRFSVPPAAQPRLELTRLNLEVQELRNRNLQLQGRLEALARRREDARGMVAYREEGPKDGGA